MRRLAHKIMANFSFLGAAIEIGSYADRTLNGQKPGRSAGSDGYDQFAELHPPKQKESIMPSISS